MTIIKHYLNKALIPIALVLGIITGVTAGVLGAQLSPADGATAKPAKTSCRAIDHRSSAGPNDDNTLEGIHRDATISTLIRSEIDGMVFADSIGAFHERDWSTRNVTTGTGDPHTSTAEYIRTIRTTQYGQVIPFMSQIMTQTVRDGGDMMMEFHDADYWTGEQITSLVDRLSAKGLLNNHWWFTGTKGALDRLAGRDGKAQQAAFATLARVAPEAYVVYRIDGDETLTEHQIERYGIDALQIGPTRTAQEIAAWRSLGLRVMARQTNPADFQQWLDKGVYTVQSNTPVAWLKACTAAGH